MTMTTPRALRILALACFCVVTVEVGYWVGVAVLVDRPDGAGAFGDMFGALNTFFAGLAFLGVICTIFMQVTAAAEARRDQSDSLRAVQTQVSLLRDDVDLQRQRDRVQAGPFFELTSCSQTGDRLDFRLKNVGAAVIVKEFAILTAGCGVHTWWPSTLPPDAEFKAPCTMPSPHPHEFRFRMGMRDRWGDFRLYELLLTTTPTGRLDFWEVAIDPRLIDPITTT
jgi:hypothetical protein